MSIRAWISLVTLVFLILIIYLARHEIVAAWGLLGRVNLWILALLIPAQIAAYFFAAEMTFSYLRQKKAIDTVSKKEEARMALEINFVNHILPSAGVSGISYMNWRLGKHGVSPGRATLAQLVRFVAGFAAFIVLLIISLLVITIDGNINRWMIYVSSLLIFFMISGTVALIYLVSSPSRSKRFARFIARICNNLLNAVRIPKNKFSVDETKIAKFFEEMHVDYLDLLKERKILIQPFIYGILFTICDALFFMISFWALGENVNPAPILIAYGLASMAGFIVITPGGAGAYEAIMAGFLAVAGVAADVAIAGILLTRVIIMLTTILLGYVLYQHAIVAYGKPRT